MCACRPARSTQFILAELDTVTDLTMSQPMVTADQVAALVVRCALDSKLERATPQLSSALTTAGYLARAAPPAADARAPRPAQQQKLRERRAG